MSNTTGLIAAAVVTIPALVVGSIAGGLAGGVVGMGAGSIANACGAENDTVENVAGTAAAVTYYGVMGYTTYSIVSGVYNAFADE